MAAFVRLKQEAAKAPIDRLLAMCHEEGECWIFHGGQRGGLGTRHEYGLVTVGSRTDGSRRTAQTHRVAYEFFVSEIPTGLELDHLCRQTLCCNPWHLDPVPHLVNCRRQILSSGEIERRRAWAKSLNERRYA